MRCGLVFERINYNRSSYRNAKVLFNCNMFQSLLIFYIKYNFYAFLAYLPLIKGFNYFLQNRTKINYISFQNFVRVWNKGTSTIKYNKKCEI